MILRNMKRHHLLFIALRIAKVLPQSTFRLLSVEKCLSKYFIFMNTRINQIPLIPLKKCEDLFVRNTYSLKHHVQLEVCVIDLNPFYLSPSTVEIKRGSDMGFVVLVYCNT